MRAPRLFAVISITIALGILPVAAAAVAWGPQRTIAQWSWSGGQTFAVSGTGDLVALTSSDRVGGAFATDRGPYEGVFVRTSSNNGQGWSAPVRVSQDKRQADRGALSSSGGSLYAAWVTQASYDRYDPAARRVLWFRSNTGGGWAATRQLSKDKGRVDAPSVAAAGKRVYVAWTDANEGGVQVARSANGGGHFKKTSIGKTTAVATDGEGNTGLPSVGATGDAVGVAWIASGSGAIKARVSTNGGKRWQNAITLVGSLGAANGGAPAMVGSDGKLIAAWTTPSGVFVRVWSGSWGATQTVASFAGDGYEGGYDVTVAPASSGSRVGIAWSACRTGSCDPLSAGTRVDVLWSVSNDGGATWSQGSVVQGSLHTDQQINEGPSVAWLGTGPVVGYTGRAAGYTSYGAFLRVGS
jgi:hypothetical protein